MIKLNEASGDAQPIAETAGGELAAVLRKGTLEERTAEFADVLAWLMTLTP